MNTIIHKRVAEAISGTNPQVITTVKSGFVVLGDAQFLKGYCLLLPNPVVANLNELKGAQRSQFLEDMANIGDAVLAVTKAVRINYEMLGNLEPALHAHIFPRFDNEPENLRTKPVWFYDWEKAPQFDKTVYAPLMTELKSAIDKHCQR